MSKSIVFDLGPAVSLTSRDLKIYRVDVEPRTLLATASLGNTDTTSTVEIDDNLECEAVLTDVRGSGSSKHLSLRFTTRSAIEYPGPSNFAHGGVLRILSMEDNSSSSSSSSLSSSSSASSSSSSSSSVSSSTSSLSSSSSSSVNSSSSSSSSLSSSSSSS